MSVRKNEGQSRQLDTTHAREQRIEALENMLKGEREELAKQRAQLSVVQAILNSSLLKPGDKVECDAPETTSNKKCKQSKRVLK